MKFEIYGDEIHYGDWMVAVFEKDIPATVLDEVTALLRDVDALAQDKIEGLMHDIRELEKEVWDLEQERAREIADRDVAAGD